jgi:hypothetical protein
MPEGSLNQNYIIMKIRIKKLHPTAKAYGRVYASYNNGLWPRLLIVIGFIALTIEAPFVCGY